MRLKKIKIKNEENYTLCVLSGKQWIAFRAVLDAVNNDGTKERSDLERTFDDIVAFLKERKTLEPKLNELIQTANKKNVDLSMDGDDVMPFRPLMYRDFMLCERHLINSSR